jgi:hypothetical protein
MAGLFPTATDGTLDTTTDATGAFWRNGMLVSPAGKLVVTTVSAGTTYQRGFVRAATGAMLIA